MDKDLSRDIVILTLNEVEKMSDEQIISFQKTTSMFAKWKNIDALSLFEDKLQNANSNSSKGHSMENLLEKMIKETDIVIDLKTNKKMICLATFSDNSFLLGRKIIPNESEFQIVQQKDIKFLNSIKDVDDFKQYSILKKILFSREIYKYESEHKNIDTLILKLKDYKLIP